MKLEGLKSKWRFWLGILVMLVGFGLWDFPALGGVVLVLGFGLMLWQIFLERKSKRNGVL